MECGITGDAEPDECVWSCEDDPVKRDKNSAPRSARPRSVKGGTDTAAPRAASAAQAAVRDVVAPLEAAITAADRAVCISLVAAEPLVEGFPPRSSLTEMARSVAAPSEAVTGVRPLKPPSRWAGELGQAIDRTARRAACDGRPGPGKDGALAVARTVEQHLGSVRMAADVVLEDEGCPATWRKTFLLVTWSHIALLAMTVDD